MPALLAGALIRRSSAVEQLTVNQLVAGSNPAAGASLPLWAGLAAPTLPT